MFFFNIITNVLKIYVQPIVHSRIECNMNKNTWRRKSSMFFMYVHVFNYDFSSIIIIIASSMKLNYVFVSLSAHHIVVKSLNTL